MSKEAVHKKKTENKKDLSDDARKKSPKELGGRDGPDPVRYGDWENKGIASDF